MLTKKTPETIKATLTVKAQGVENSLMLTYWNRSPAELDAFVKNPENMKVPDGVDIAREPRKFIGHLNAGVCLYVVKSFDDGTEDSFPLTRDGLMELEDYWPEALGGIVQGYHAARGAAVAKN